MILKKGIQVKVIAGKDKGKVGEILEINRRLSKKWPILTNIKDAPIDAKDWEGKKGKLSLLEE